MRVITGKAKGRRLQSVPGDSTRPITDRAKEALFSILGDWIVGARVLDLFGGTGSVGIECLSRGAEFVQFIDANRRAVETIQANLLHTRLDAGARVERGDSFAWLQRYHGEPFDLVYVAPPQYQGMWSRALQIIDSRSELLSEVGTVIVQIHPREDVPVALQRLQEYDRRKYGSVMLLFFATAEALAAGDESEEDEDVEDEYVDDAEADDYDEPLDDELDELDELDDGEEAGESGDADDDDDEDDDDDDADREDLFEEDPEEEDREDQRLTLSGGGE